MMMPGCCASKPRACVPQTVRLFLLPMKTLAAPTGAAAALLFLLSSTCPRGMDYFAACSWNFNPLVHSFESSERLLCSRPLDPKPTQNSGVGEGARPCLHVRPGRLTTTWYQIDWSQSAMAVLRVRANFGCTF